MVEAFAPWLGGHFEAEVGGVAGVDPAEDREHALADGSGLSTIGIGGEDRGGMDAGYLTHDEGGRAERCGVDVERLRHRHVGAVERLQRAIFDRAFGLDQAGGRVAAKDEATALAVGGDGVEAIGLARCAAVEALQPLDRDRPAEPFTKEPREEVSGQGRTTR